MGRRLGLDEGGECEQPRDEQAADGFGQLCSHVADGGSDKCVLLLWVSD